jgi:hypothetical protein
MTPLTFVAVLCVCATIGWLSYAAIMAVEYVVRCRRK